MAVGEISTETAGKILRIKADTLDMCAAAVMMDRPDLANKWRREAQELRNLLGDPVDDEDD